MIMNNFQRLLEEEGRRMPAEDSEKILNNIWGALGFIRMMGEVVDIYVSRVGGVMIMATGGDMPAMGPDTRQTPSRHKDSPEFPRPDQRQIKPGAPDDPDRRA